MAARKGRRGKGATLGTGKAGAEQRRRLFVDAYFAHNQNLTQACIAMGYSKKSAPTMGCNFMKLPDVAAAVEARRAELARKFALSAETVTQFWGRVARLDVSQIYDEDGKLLPMREWPEDVRLLVDAVDVKEVFNKLGRGEDAVAETTRTSKVDFPKRAAVMDQVARHFGMYAKDKQGAAGADDSEPPAPVSVTIDFKDARRRPR